MYSARRIYQYNDDDILIYLLIPLYRFHLFLPCLLISCIQFLLRDKGRHSYMEGSMFNCICIIIILNVVIHLIDVYADQCSKIQLLGKLRKSCTDVGLKCKQKILFLFLSTFAADAPKASVEICLDYGPSKPVLRCDYRMSILS